jgi:hypothetical protein
MGTSAVTGLSVSLLTALTVGFAMPHGGGVRMAQAQEETGPTPAETEKRPTELKAKRERPPAVRRSGGQGSRAPIGPLKQGDFWQRGEFQRINK